MKVTTVSALSLVHAIAGGEDERRSGTGVWPDEHAPMHVRRNADAGQRQHTTANHASAVMRSLAAGGSAVGPASYYPIAVVRVGSGFSAVVLSVRPSCSILPLEVNTS